MASVSLADLLVFAVVSCWVVLAPAKARAEKVWMAAGDGLWRDGTNWSGHTAPDITSFIKITNDVTKTITVDDATPAANLTVQKITVSAPPGVTNTILLSSLGLANPLVLQTGLELLDGAAVRITNSALLTQLTNDHVNIDGSLTLDTGLIDFGDTTVTARVGRVTSGTFTINGGLVSAGALTVGGLTNSAGFLNINGGTLNIASIFSVGRNQGTTGTVAVLGGQVNVPNDDTRVGDDGMGFLTVSNATLSLNNLQVGRDTSGTVSLLPGGTVQVALDTVLGKFAGCTGALSVAGGQFSGGGQKLSVGRGGAGQLTMSSGLLQAGSLVVCGDTTNSIGGSGVLALSGGTILLSSNFVVGSASFSTGQVSMTGGQLTVTNAGGSGAIFANSGTILVSGGTITADRLLVTNSSSEFLLHSGTLNTRLITVANGVPFVVGDGVSQAVLNLQGGRHTFANGLVISSNATLSGCGTVVGSIVNQGTISTNCGGVGPNAPLVVTPPQSETVPVTSNALFTVVANGTAPLAYQWQLAGTNVLGATASSYSRPNVQLSDAGTYTVVVTNMAGSVTSAPALLTVVVPPSIAAQPQDQTVPAGSNMTFSVVANGTAPLAYQWQLAGTNVLGATASSYSRPTVQLSDAGTYTVVITNMAGSMTSAPAVLTVISSPPQVSLALQRAGTGTNIISFSSQRNSIYTLEFKQAITDPIWTEIPPSANGTGGTISLLDPAATGASRFYRVRIQ